MALSANQSDLDADVFACARKRNWSTLTDVRLIKLVDVLLYFHFCSLVITQIIAALSFSGNHVKILPGLERNGARHTGQTVNTLSGPHDKYHKV